MESVSKHLKVHSVPSVWLTKDFVFFFCFKTLSVFIHSVFSLTLSENRFTLRIQRILLFSLFLDTFRIQFEFQLNFKGFCCFPVSRHFPYLKDFASFAVSRHFPYSKDFSVQDGIVARIQLDTPHLLVQNRGNNKTP